MFESKISILQQQKWNLPPCQKGGNPPPTLRHANYLIYLHLGFYAHYSKSFEPKISLLQQKLTKIRNLPPCGKGGLTPSPLRHVNYIVYILLSTYTHYSELFEPKISLLWQKLTKLCPMRKRGAPPPLMECHLGPTPRDDPNGPRNHPSTRAKL